MQLKKTFEDESIVNKSNEHIIADNSDRATNADEIK